MDMEEMKKADVAYKIDQSKIDTLLATIKSDKALMSTLNDLGIIDEEIPSYLSLLSAYQDNRKQVKGNPDALLMVLEISDSGKLTFHYEESEKNKKINTIKRNYIFRDFPDEYLSLLTGKGKSKIDTNFSKAFAEAAEKKEWFYAYGESGSGKTYLMISSFNNIAYKGRKVACINANKRFEELKSLAIDDKKKFDEMMNALSTVEFLIIDDFGSEFKSDYVRDIVIMPLLNNRSKNKLFTAFTSDMNLDELEQVYDYKYGAKIYAKKLVSLIRRNLKDQNGYKLQKSIARFAD